MLPNTISRLCLLKQEVHSLTLQVNDLYVPIFNTEKLPLFTIYNLLSCEHPEQIELLK